MNIIEKIKQILCKNNPVIIEIGCATGKDTKNFLDIFSDIELYCFEPDPRNIEKFVKSINDKRCHFYKQAIGNFNGHIDFHQSDGISNDGENNTLSGSIKKPKYHCIAHPWVKFDRMTKVKIEKLDTWSKRNNIFNIDLIWADVNGAEQDLIIGAEETLKNTKYLYTEFGPDGAELYDGELKKNQILKKLPYFNEVFVNGHNILLKNTRIV